MLNSDSAMVETGVEEAPNMSYCHDFCSITGAVYKKLKLNVDFWCKGTAVGGGIGSLIGFHTFKHTSHSSSWISFSIYFC